MQPPKTNCSQFLVSLLKYQRGIAARHGPWDDGNLHLSGSSTAIVEVAAKTIDVYRMFDCDEWE